MSREIKAKEVWQLAKGAGNRLAWLKCCCDHLDQLRVGPVDSPNDAMQKAPATLRGLIITAHSHAPPGPFQAGNDVDREWKTHLTRAGRWR